MLTPLKARLASVASLVEWLCLVGGLALTLRYAWLMDDAYIYFRYADNLTLYGHGLVYNPGEYVEGFSSPFWMLLLAGMRSLGFNLLNYWVMVVGIGLGAWVGTWWIAVRINRAMTPGSIEALNLPLVYLTTTYGVICYFTSGLESPLTILGAAIFALGILRPAWIPGQIVAGLLPLVRHELILPLVLMVLWSIGSRSGGLTKRVPWVLLATFVATIGAYGFWRVWYYADFFPNTFYLKDIVWVEQGLAYLYDTAIAYRVLPVSLLAIGAMLAARSRFELHGFARLCMLACALLVTAYTIKIGGDARHFRYLAFPFALAVFALGGLAEGFLASALRKRRHLVLAGVGLAALASFTGYPRQLAIHPVLGRLSSYDHTEFRKIKDAAVHRYSNRGVTPAGGGGELSIEDARERFETGDATVLNTSWCQTGYLNPAAPVVNPLGLTDPFLARMEMESDRPAHKLGLKPYGEELMVLRRTYGFRRGAFAAAVADGAAPVWVAENLGQLEQIEIRAYNDHDLARNFGLAIQRLERISPAR